MHALCSIAAFALSTDQVHFLKPKNHPLQLLFGWLAWALCGMLGFSCMVMLE